MYLLTDLPLAVNALPYWEETREKAEVELHSADASNTNLLSRSQSPPTNSGSGPVTAWREVVRSRDSAGLDNTP